MKLEEHINHWIKGAEHDLETAEKTTITLTTERKIFLDQVNDFNLEVRYPEFKNEFYKTCTKGFTEPKFSKIKETFQWLKSQII